MPVYNPILIVATSSFQTLLNYQLVSSVYCRGQLLTKIKTPVNPDGYLVVDIHKHLQNKVEYHFTPNSTGFQIATQSMATYSVDFSHEFRHEWGFYDNAYSPIGGTAYTGFVSQQTPYFSVGDQVYIAQTAGYTYPSYNGVHGILSITQSGLTWSIVTDALWEGSSPVNGGTMTYADWRLTTVSSTYSTGKKFTFNGVQDFVPFISWDYTDWDANPDPVGKFFTNAPSGYALDIDSHMFLNCYGNVNNDLRTVYIRSNLGTYSMNNPFTTISADQRRFISINLSPQYMASQGWINSTTKTVDIWMENITDQTIATQSFAITNNCSRYSKMELLFMDKMGSFLPYTFDKVNRQTKRINRSDYQQFYGTYAPSSNGFVYNTWDRGKKSLDIVVVDEYTLNSDWVDQKTSDYLMELFTSPEVYLIDEDGLILAINLTVANIERKQIINEQLINYTLTFELSNKNMTQK